MSDTGLYVGYNYERVGYLIQHKLKGLYKEFLNT